MYSRRASLSDLTFLLTIFALRTLKVFLSLCIYLLVYFLSLGLKQALATVNDYNPLMKDFPINDLLSATELDRIRHAVQQIFTHLRKIRNTKYPMTRGLRLVEAISRDLTTQLLKVGFILVFTLKIKQTINLGITLVFILTKKNV